MSLGTTTQEGNKTTTGSGQQYQYTFTVFTPTYNRAYTLHRVYKSLEAQTFRDFEWLVVDDGSTDNTREIVAQWQKKAGFPIRYIYQRHSGRHVAHNLAVQEVRGELFLPLDSDDECVPQAMERFKYHWDSIPRDQRDEFACICALTLDQSGNLVGDKFPRDVMDSNWMELRYKYRIRVEGFAVLRTDVLRHFPFPVPEGYFYVPEGVVWYAISQEFKARFINEVLHTYWYREIGRSDQLASGSLRRAPSKDALGMALWHQAVLNRAIGWFRYAPLEFLRSAFHYARFSFHARRGASGQIKELDNTLARVLWTMMLPIGFVLYWKDPKETPN